MATRTRQKPKAKPSTTPRDKIVSARLSPEERADLDAVIARWQARAEAEGYPVAGFTDWLRSIIRREKRAAEAGEES
jgi:hypothetical protein